MGWWNDVNVEPKRAFRFLMTLGSEASRSISSYFIKTVKKPNFTMDGAQEVKYIGHTFKYPGRMKWEDVTVTIIDPASPDASAALMNILQASGYNSPRAANLNAQVSISKASAQAALGGVKISQINAAGHQIDSWSLVNPFLIGVDFGELSYDTDDIVNYTLTISYDHATFATNGSVGPTVHPNVKTQ
jgi:hypothetical protein